MYTFPEVESMRLIRKSNPDAGFQVWHQGLSHFGQIVKTILINLGSKLKDEGESALQKDGDIEGA